MSFIQKLIERKTQATGSVASQHVVEDDLAAQEADVIPHDDEISVVDIVDLDDPDAPMQDDTQIAESVASPPERSDNVLSLTDPFILDEEDEIDNDISDLPDLEAENIEEADQGIAAVSDFDDDMDIDDIDADDEAFNIWDVDADSEPEKPEIEEPAPEQIQEASPPEPEPQVPPVQSIEPVNQDFKPKTPEPAPEATAEVTSESTRESTEETADIQPEEPQPEEPVAPPLATVAPPPDATVPADNISAVQSPTPEQPAAAPKAPGKRRIGRVKTRLLGFEHASKPGIDLFERSAAAELTTEPDAEKVAQPRFPVGWFVVIDGPGRGETFALHAGMSQIGRGEGQAVQLDFGDETISRNNHAAIVYDDEAHTFLMGHGGKTNVVRLNSKPLICTEEVKNTDLIRIGETTLRLVVLCTAEFNWESQNSKGPDDVAIA